MQHEPISWDEALSTIASKFLALRDAGEARAIANKTSGRLPRGTGSLVGRYFSLLGSPNDTDVGPVCNDAGGNALAWTAAKVTDVPASKIRLLAEAYAKERNPCAGLAQH